jgi:hypothetical protein
MSYIIQFQLSIINSPNIAYGNVKYLATLVRQISIYLPKIKNKLNSAKYVASFRVMCNNTGKAILHNAVKYKILPTGRIAI